VQVIINVSVWEDISSLENFTYQTMHTEFLKRKKEWFKKYGQAHYALWWIEVSKFPRIEQATSRLKYLQKHGPSQKAFDFRKKYATHI